jgi:predicted ferric reductase
MAIVVPIAAAATSPFLAYRGPVYIIAGFAGIVALALMLVQPLLIGGYLPGIPAFRSRRLHQIVGGGIVVAVVVHVVGLWITSPPDVVDALLFVSPTPFSNWGVIAMWAVFAMAVVAALRHKLRLSPRNWRMAHGLLAVVFVLGTLVHALLIEGAMETISKAALCAVVFATTAKVIFDLGVRIARASPRHR